MEHNSELLNLQLLDLQYRVWYSVSPTSETPVMISVCAHLNINIPERIMEYRKNSCHMTKKVKGEQQER